MKRSFIIRLLVLFTMVYGTGANAQIWTSSDAGLVYNQGDVGIGTVTPDAKLSVKGTTHAREVKIDLQVTAPDYVFAPDYSLATLKAVKAYIEQHRHLPEIPSADEMEQNGIDIGTMSMLLLKKVEELTLYQVELQDRIRTSLEKLEGVK